MLRPPRPRTLLRRALAYSSVEGVFAELVNACAGSAVLTGWALQLGCSPFQLGVLGALPFLAQLVQLPAAWVTATFGRRRVAIAIVAASRQMYLALAALAVLPLSDAGKRAVLLAVAAVVAVLSVMGNNAWVAWMGDLVPASLRGRYFGRRNALCTLGGTLGGMAAGVLLDRARGAGNTGVALSLLALLASAFGAVATVLMAKQYDPGERGNAAVAATPRVPRALAPYRDPSARRLLTYQFAWNAAVGLSSSFYAVHLLQNLRVGFVGLSLVSALAALARAVTARFWGRALDHAGARPVLVTCSFGLALVPVIWLAPTAEFPFPLALDALITGVLTSGHSLASFALPLRVAPRDERPYYLAAFATSAGVAFGLAGAAGGALAGMLPAHFVWGGRTWVGLHALFVVGATARLCAAAASVRVMESGSRGVRALWKPRRAVG